MTGLKTLLGVVCVITLSGCSKGLGGSAFRNFFNTNSSSASNSSNPSDPIIPVSQVETVKLQQAIKADPIYKIEDSEIDLLQKEGIVTEADIAQLQAIQ